MSNNCQLVAAAHCVGGIDFPAPARSWFGPVREYLLNEIQKAEIISMLITRRPILRPVMFVVVLVMWVMALAALVWLCGAGRNNPTPTDLVVMTVVIVAPGRSSDCNARCDSGEAHRNLEHGAIEVNRIPPSPFFRMA